MEHCLSDFVDVWSVIMLHIQEVRAQTFDRNLTIMIKIFVVFLALKSKFRNSTLKLGHNCFITVTFKFIIHNHLTFDAYSLHS